MLALFNFAFNLSESPVSIFRRRMNERHLSKVVLEGNVEELGGSEDAIVQYISDVMRSDHDEKKYIIFGIGAYSDCVVGLRMFEIFRRVSRNNSPYHWHEIMASVGHSLMQGAASSQNIKILEHVMCHVDEIELEKTLYEIEAPVVKKWYDENFVSM